MTPASPSPSYLSLLNRRIAAMALLGFASGLPLALSGGTLQAWLAVENVDIKTIGLFSLVAVPYTFKFLWSPLMDRFVPPWLGRRRGWMLCVQFTLLLVIATMAGVDPERHILAVGMLALGLAFFSASQDVAIDAYRTDTLRAPERGFGASVFVAGYRIAMLVSGGGALILANYFGFETTYLVMGVLMIIGIGATLSAPEPITPAGPATLIAAYRDPFVEFLRRNGAFALLALIVLYKLGDAFAGTLTTAFLIRGTGFDLAEVGAIYKGFGVLVTIFGALFGGAIMLRLGLYRSLMVFGVLQAATNLGFMALAAAGKNYLLMIAVIGLENFAGGMGTAAFVAFLMSLCDHRYTATQYAMLSALAATGRVFVGPPAGILVASVDWTWFFFWTFVLALPGLALLRMLRAKFDSLEAGG